MKSQFWSKDQKEVFPGQKTSEMYFLIKKLLKSRIWQKIRTSLLREKSEEKFSLVKKNHLLPKDQLKVFSCQKISENPIFPKDNWKVISNQRSVKGILLSTEPVIYPFWHKVRSHILSKNFRKFFSCENTWKITSLVKRVVQGLLWSGERRFWSKDRKSLFGKQSGERTFLVQKTGERSSLIKIPMKSTLWWKDK